MIPTRSQNSGLGIRLASAQRLLHRDHLHGYVADFGEEAVEHGAAQQNVERERTGWPKITCEMLSCCANRISASATFLSIQRDHLGAEIAGHAAILLDALKGLRIAVALVVVGPVHVDGVPVGRQPAGYARAHADTAARFRAAC